MTAIVPLYRIVPWGSDPTSTVRVGHWLFRRSGARARSFSFRLCVDKQGDLIADPVQQLHGDGNDDLQEAAPGQRVVQLGSSRAAWS